jgi:glutamate carboxypeptidase
VGLPFFIGRGRLLSMYHLCFMPAAGSSLLGFLEQQQSAMLEVLRRMVEIESPSDNKAAVDQLGKALAAEFAGAGAKTKLHSEAGVGNHLQAWFPGAPNKKPILLLGHFDTVWPLGTLNSMPFRVEGGRAFGPGIYDMKAGITMMLFALRALRSTGAAHRPVTVLLDTDEEVGSVTGRPLVEAVAKECEAVLVLEPSQGPQGHLKTARKGVGDYTLRVRGRASHAGVDFEKGHSAIVELSRQILEIAKFTDISRGITVNPGVINGGTRTNVVAAEATAEVDIRVARGADATELEQKFAALRPFDPACSLEVSGGLNRPPMERTEGTVRLYRMAQQHAAELGMPIDEASTGGGSDGNFTSALGLPTLDGLGAVGEGAHAVNESIVLSELPRRTALLACLLASL